MKQKILQFIFSFILISSIFTMKSKSQEFCYVLALEGGGDKGAYQAGVLKGLVDNEPNQLTKWDVVTGVSVGALNAASIAIFDVGDEINATDFALTKWRNIKGKGDIFQNWWLGPLYGLFKKTSLYDTTPLNNLLDNVVNNSTLKRRFIIGATSITNGTYHTWDEETLTRDEVATAILASAAYPVVFSNVEFRNSNYMDGGVKISVDIASGINKCLDMGFDESKITVDVVLLNSKTLPYLTSEKIQPLEVLMRVFEIYGYDNAMRDLNEITEFFPKVNYRYIVAPTIKLPSGAIPLTFSPADIEKMIEAGIADAKKIIGKGPKTNMNHLLSEYRRERSNLVGIKERRVLKTQIKEDEENLPRGFLSEF